MSTTSLSMSLCLALLVSSALADYPKKMKGCSGSATYTVTNECVWSSATHPVDYPSGTAHWSPLCGTAHDSSFKMYAVGEVTTVAGVKEIAELGDCSVLGDSLATCMESDSCSELTKIPCSTFSGTCDHVGKIVVDGGRPYVSLISMVAPSPDWMVGVSGVSLCDAGVWKKEYTKALGGIDAGTDSGVTFTSSNVASDPLEPVTAFDAMDTSNIFYHPSEEVLNPLCTLTLTLDA